MIPISKALTDEEARSAATYFASMMPTAGVLVVEAAMVAKSAVGQGAMRLALPDPVSAPSIPGGTAQGDWQ